MSLLSECNAHGEVAEVLTMPRPGKLNRGLGQCERTCGHGNSGSASQCEHSGGDLATGEHFLESEKMGTETVLWTGEITTVITLMLLT